MSRGAVTQGHKRNLSQHKILAAIVDRMNRQKTGAWDYVPCPDRERSQTRDITIVKEADMEMQEDQENQSDRRPGRPEKKVTWSRDLLQVRSISPRQKSPRTPKMAQAVRRIHHQQPSKSQEAVGRSQEVGGRSQEAGVRTDCSHFLCQRVGRGSCLQEEGAPPRPGLPSLRCSPQMQAVVWRSIPVTRADLTLDLHSPFLQGEGIV